jgi:hypothetical protein
MIFPKLIMNNYVKLLILNVFLVLSIGIFCMYLAKSYWFYIMLDWPIKINNI